MEEILLEIAFPANARERQAKNLRFAKSKKVCSIFSSFFARGNCHFFSKKRQPFHFIKVNAMPYLQLVFRSERLPRRIRKLHAVFVCFQC